MQLYSLSADHQAIYSKIAPNQKLTSSNDRYKTARLQHVECHADSRFGSGAHWFPEIAPGAAATAVVLAGAGAGAGAAEVG